MLVLESTYGDRLHEGRDNRAERLESILCHTMVNRGVTIIPAFSLGRTQELLYEMNRILEAIEFKRTCSLIDNIEVIVDSPMALKLTDVYHEMQEFWSDEAHRILTIDSQPLIFKNLVEVDNSGESITARTTHVELLLPGGVSGSVFRLSSSHVSFRNRHVSPHSFASAATTGARSMKRFEM